MIKHDNTNDTVSIIFENPTINVADAADNMRDAFNKYLCNALGQSTYESIFQEDYVEIAKMVFKKSLEYISIGY